MPKLKSGNDFYVCEHCNKSIVNKSNFNKHVKCCSVKIEEEKNLFLNTQQEKILYLEKTLEEYKKINLEQAQKIECLAKKIDDKNENFISTLCKNMEQMQTFSNTTITKSMDALTFLITHRKKAPELKQLTNEKAQALLKLENRLYDYLLFYNNENMLDQYVGKIILKHIKKENPDDQSIWNTDVSRLTYIIRDVVDSSPTWLRDPKGALFNEKIITPIINELKEYLYRCVHSKNPDEVSIHVVQDKAQLNSDDESSDSDEETNDIYKEHDHMMRSMKILGVVNTLRSTKFRKRLSEYIASNIPLHKSEPKNKSKSKKSLSDNSISDKK